MVHIPTSGFSQIVLVMAFSALTGIIIAVIFKARRCYITAQIRRRTAERADERIRIARDLHDTLLQGVQTLTLRFQYAAREVAAGRTAGPLLNAALEAADRVLSEGRDRVRQLRLKDHRELAEAFAIVGRDHNWLYDVSFRVTVEGVPHPLHPDCQEELYGIGREAITNAFRHARASKIECIIVYETKGLRITCRDDGIGMQRSLFSQDRGKEHWGTIGMKERANRIGANLRLRSKTGEGTEISLSVPGSRAYLRNEKSLGLLLPWRMIGKLKEEVLDLSRAPYSIVDRGSDR
jgi:signal transduction histidine kinase